MMTRLLSMTAAAAIALGLGASIVPALRASAAARPVEPAPVPASLEVPDGNDAFLEGKAAGTQNYICLPGAVGFNWTLTGPQATLFLPNRGELQQIATHYLSVGPGEADLARPTWQDSSDSSRVWGRARASSTDPNYVEAGAIAWVLLEADGTKAGPRDGATLASVTFVQRIHTAGGIAPATGCTQASEVGAVALVPFTADYVFYRASAKR